MKDEAKAVRAADGAGGKRAKVARKAPSGLLRMKDLVRRTGVNRDTIHYYISERLLPPPVRKERNMAWYSEEHVYRIETIRRLQSERFLPLKAIKAILDGEGERTFSSDQRVMLDRLSMEVRRQRDGATEPALPLASVRGAELLERSYIEELVDRGIIEVEDPGGRDLVSHEDAAIIEALADIQRVVARPEGSWLPEDLDMLNGVVKMLFEQELAIFSTRFPDVGPNDFGEVIDQCVAAINRMFATLHRKRIREFIVQLTDAQGESKAPDEDG